MFTSREQLDDLGTGHGYENVYVRDLARDRTVMVSRGQLTRPEPPPPSSNTPSTPILKLGHDHHDHHDPAPVPGEVPPDQSSYQPTISADGRYVAFVTTATNIVADDADNDQDILVCDRDPDGDGDLDERNDGENEGGDRDYRYVRVTTPVTSGGEFPARLDHPSWPRLSDDAGRIVWQDKASSGDYTYDRVKTASLVAQPGGPVTAPAAVEFVDGTLPGTHLYAQTRPDVSGNGEYVVFAGRYSGGEGSHGFSAIVRTPVAAGDPVRVDLDEDLTPVGGESVVDRPAVSADGAEIAFTAETSTAGSVTYRPNVYVLRLDGQARPVDSVLASRDTAGKPVDGTSPALSGDGRFVAFVTDSRGVHDGTDTETAPTCLRTATYATGSAPSGDAHGDTVTCQVVVRDLVVDRARQRAHEPRLPGTLGSPAAGDCGCGGNDNTTPYQTAPSLSRDGARVAYDSDASNLVEGDGNESTDVFVRTFRPTLRAVPVEFGDVLVGTPFAATARFDHAGLGPLSVAKIEVAGDDAADFVVGDDTCVGFVVQQAGSCLVEVAFTPAAEGSRSAVLRLVLADERELTVDLHGTGTAAPPPGGARFAAGPDPVDFGERLPLSHGPVSTVTVTNGGESPMDVTAVAIDAPVAGYTVGAQTCTAAPLPPGGTCTVSVRFSPTASGELAAVLRFEDTAPGAPHLVGLHGSGAPPAIEVSPAVTPPGRVVMVSGRDFAPGQPITVAAPGAVQTDPVSARQDGTFRANLLILPKAAIGDFTVVATVSDAPAVNAEKPLLVVTPTVSPADFVVRG